ncbi:amidohydrolase family protein [Streptomyces bohaiensis]|uniref:Amidohydrolase family protein n=1 Tax=Streptomyces bohaiensis TaxID=1431344 RepID=A0ABX1C795_9ACTN|nr:amidohydrolase family protein [Streptomyces bohaiensis]NJQ15044.1 amidohydrolase family protein [Streptomyces bohaiensis]
MTVVRIRGRALPDGEPVDLRSDGDRWATGPAPGAETVIEGWLLPGLVDAHTHPGIAEGNGAPFDTDLLRADLNRHLDAGVTAVRVPGLPEDPPSWFGTDPALPRGWWAGRWITQHGQYFDGWARRLDHAQMAEAAAEQARRSGWVKVVADWVHEGNAIPVDVLTAMVEAVHAAGGRIAVHSMHESGCAAAVEAGVDSLEHGMGLDPRLLARMAAQGTALTPTLTMVQAPAEDIRAHAPHGAPRDWYLQGADAHPELVVRAVEAGVTLLAGTDSRPHGRIADEIHSLVRAGVRPHDALAAASWAARSWLGLPGLVPGAPADAVVYDTDPRTDLSVLDRPAAVVLRGAVVRTAVPR